jgi:hypothetical protein
MLAKVSEKANADISSQMSRDLIWAWTMTAWWWVGSKLPELWPSVHMLQILIRNLISARARHRGEVRIVCSVRFLLKV